MDLDRHHIQTSTRIFPILNFTMTVVGCQRTPWVICIWFCLQLLPTCAFIASSPRRWYVGPLFSASEKKSKKQFPICLIATDQVVLPGETATLWTDEQELIDDCVENNYGVLALGVIMEETDGEIQESDDLLEIASLCEIKECEDNGGEDGVFVTVTCVGRVRLDRLQQTSPYIKFYCTKVKDDVGDLDKSNMVADNIEIFMKKLSQRERESWT